MDESPGCVGGGQSSSALTLDASLELHGDGSRIAHARQHAAAFLAEARDDHGILVATGTIEVVQLIVSELVTNARKYAPGPAILHLRIAGPVLQVELWDSSPVLPAAETPDPHRVGQHGLELVTALARTVTVEPAAVGKRITAEIDLDTTGV
ncbi:ATP-binding protein [Streptomyces sp. NPDC093509]|uniref:ATP-binding protein n=1 Tax=Streptomyces sp. NPDC093509 TaxID=3154982 RepID=UPI00344E4210